MAIEKEKKILYDLMREIIEERRILTKLYFDLKEQIRKINTPTINEEHDRNNPIIEKKRSISTLKKEKEIQEANYFRKNRTAHHVSFERIANSVVFILKNSPIPLSNKELISRLTSEFEIHLTSSNLTCNILPRMHKDDSIPVYRAYRGYWQYRR
ncbi:hypothetical protein [Enterococcus sp. DIV0756]|uniref:hypothetical protein n=1 Tax=Enterococcus sp. DIV0756 TaxID=2774636 RepID=UPI003F2148EC